MVKCKGIAVIFISISLVIGIPCSHLRSQEVSGNDLIEEALWKNREIEYVSGQIMVILRSTVSEPAVMPLLSKYGARIIHGLTEA